MNLVHVRILCVNKTVIQNEMHVLVLQNNAERMRK
jgi:hypothetical protein